MKIRNLALLLFTGLLLQFAFPAMADPPCLVLPGPTANEADAEVTVTFGSPYGAGISPELSLFNIDVLAGDGISNPIAPIPAGSYAGWCVDVQTDITPADGGSLYRAQLYSTCDPTLAFENYLPADHSNLKNVSAATWKKINYLINHRATPPSGCNPTMWEVQLAIFTLLGEPLPASPPYPPFTQANVDCLVNDAIANADLWKLKCGDKVAVIFLESADWIFPENDPNAEIQILILEVPFVCPPPCCTIIPASPTNEAEGVVSVTFGDPYGNGVDPDFSLFHVELTDGPAAIPDGGYPAWCVDVATDIDPSKQAGGKYTAQLYSTSDPNLAFEAYLPEGHSGLKHASADAWRNVNYLINHRLEACNGTIPTMWEVQQAIFTLLGETPLPHPDHSFDPNLFPQYWYPEFRDDVVQCLVSRPVPDSWQIKCGDKVAVIFLVSYNWLPDVNPADDLQVLILEVPCCPPVHLTPGPLATCFLTEDAAIQAAIAATTVDVGCCDIKPLTAVITGDDCNATITVTGVNACGKSTSIAYSPVHIDGTAPIITGTPTGGSLSCNPADASLPTDASVKAQVTATETCSIATINVSHVDSTLGCLVTRTFTITATDLCNNTSAPTTVVYTWTVDTTAPVVTVPAGGSFTCNPVDSSLPTDATVKAQVTATETCSTATINVSHVDSTVGCLVTRTFTVTATDLCSNTSTPKTVVYTWTVDTTAPVVTVPAGGSLSCNPPIASLPTDATVKAQVTATETCSAATIYVSHVDSTVGCLVTRTFTVTATDLCSNTSAPKTVVYTWTVDTTAPVVTVPAGGSLSCNPPIASLPTDATVKAQVTATETCSAATIYVSHVDSTVGCLVTRTFTVTATDLCSNTSAPKTVVYTWTVDTTAPVVTVPAGGSLSCNPPIASLPTDATVKAQVTATETCSAATIYVSHVDSTVGCLVTRTFTVTATDLCSNTSAPKTVVYTWTADTTAPVLVCVPDKQLGCGSATGPDVTGTPTATDGCSSGADIKITYSDYVTVNASGDTIIKRTWTAMDKCGNTATCCQTITVKGGNCDPGTASFGGTGGTKSSYSFTADNGVTVKVTAFARNKSSGVWSSALVGQYSPGLGVTSPGEDGSSPNHTLDNSGSNGGKDNNNEYMLFEFSAPVTVTQAYLGWVYNDSDMTVWMGDLPSPTALSDSVLAGLTKEDNNTTSSSPRWAAFNAGLKTGTAFVVAAQPGDINPDYFKVSILKFCKPSCTPPVPVTANCVSVTAVNGTPITPVTMVGAGGCGGPYSFSAVGLPNGLVMSSGGTISGTPSVTGTYNYTVTITDNCGKTGTANCSVCVTAPPPPPQTCTTTTTFDFTGGNTPVKGYAGNILPFSGGSVNVKVSAFARNRTTGAWVTAYLGDYSHGLGVTDVNGEKEDGNNNTHTVDNVGGWDNYVLFEFSQVVTIDSMYLGYVVGDSDLTLKIGTFTDPYNNHLLTSQLNGFGYTEDNNTTSSSPRTAVVNQGSPRISGNAILVAASLSDVTPDDYFKISTLNICSPSGTPPPPPWKDCDFGTCQNGSCTYKNSCHTVCGSGDDIWNNSDSCHFEWQPASGDCTIIARCTGVGNTDPWAKAGVMIRETLNGDSKHVSCFATPGNGCAFQYRSTTGGSSANSNQTGINAPCWLKMVRSGNSFTGYRSNDGWNWTQCGQVNVSMGTSCYIGLAVTSHNSGAVCTATFDNVTATP